MPRAARDYRDQFPAICIIRPRAENRLIERLFPRRCKTSDSQPVSAGADNIRTHTCGGSPCGDTHRTQRKLTVSRRRSERCERSACAGRPSSVLSHIFLLTSVIFVAWSDKPRLFFIVFASLDNRIAIQLVTWSYILAYKWHWAVLWEFLIMFWGELEIFFLSKIPNFVID